MERAVARTIAIIVHENTENSRDLDLCMEYCHLHYGKKHEEIAIYKNSDLAGEDTVLSTVMKDARAGRLQAVVCARLDTVCYNTAELSLLLEELSGLSVSFAAVEEQLDTATPLGRVAAYLASSFVRLDQRGAARRVRDSMLEHAREGRWLGGVSPTGYRSIKLPNANGPAEYALELLPSEASVVSLIFDVYLECNSLTELERHLDEKGITTKNGRKYTRFSIRQLLENPVYMLADKAAYTYFDATQAELCSSVEQFDGEHGMMVYNKTLQTAGKGAKTRDISEWIVAVGRHGGIISGAKWIQVQELLSLNKPGGDRKPKSAHALLVGLLYCGDCEACMRPKLTQRLTEDGQPMFIYLCERKERSKSVECRMRNVSGNQLDRVVCDQLLSLSPDSPMLLEQLERNMRAAQPMPDHTQTNALIERKGEIERTISELVFSLVKAINKQAYDYIIKEIDALHKESEELQVRIDEFAAVSQAHPMSGEQIAAMQDILRGFQQSFDSFSIQQKRAALRALVERVIWDGQSVRVFLYGADIGETAVE